MNIAKKYEEKYQLLSDKKYLKRLADFVDGCCYLDTETKITEEDNLSLTDVSKLSDLFYELVSYAMDIYVYPKTEEFETYLVVKMAAKYYQIGRMEGQGAFTYITTPDDVPNEDDVIDLTDLSKVNYRAMKIEKALEEITDFIETTRTSNNIPTNAILSAITEYVREIENQN